MILAELLVKLTGDTKEFESSLGKADAALKKTEKQAGGLKGGMSGLFKSMMPAIGWGAVGAAIGVAIKEFAEAEKNVAKLTNQLRLMKGATADTVSSFQDIAAEMQSKTGIADDDVLNAMMTLTRTTNDYNVALNGTNTVMDLAAATGMDLNQAALLLGRAYNGDTDALKRYGVVLKEGIKGQEVMTEINKRFGGQAAAQAETLDGSIKKLQATIGSFAEESGRIMAPFFKTMINEWLVPAIKFWTRLLGKVKDTKQGMVTAEMTKRLIEQGNILDEARKKHTKLVKEKGSLNAETRAANLHLIEETKTFSKLMKQYEEAKNKTVDFSQAQNELGVETESTAEKLKKAEAEADAYAKKIEKTASDLSSQASEIAGTITPLVTGVTQALLDNQMTMNEKMSAILKSGLYALLEVISIQIKAYIAAEAAKAVATGGLTAGTVAAVAGQLVAVDALKASVGTIKLADGGILTKPVFSGGYMAGEAGPEAVLPLDRLQPMMNRAVQSSITTNMGGIMVQIQAQKIDNNTNFDAVAVKIDKALNKLSRQRGER